MSLIYRYRFLSVILRYTEDFLSIIYGCRVLSLSNLQIQDAFFLN